MSMFVWETVWERGVLCRFGQQECSVLLCIKVKSRWINASLRSSPRKSIRVEGGKGVFSQSGVKTNFCGLLLETDFLFLFPLQYMDKPPPGKHSTKGIGKNKPLETEFEKWGDVTVPCGRPVPSAISNTSLLYNEYIVYNTNQV